ncbi:MAG TPA: LLM class flavin-dependent oxidoreductase [Solirubrobacterales bacterium]|nr:LLM class flavin-dependent oxidoreductase [Solirubrobacterales bacterium]
MSLVGFVYLPVAHNAGGWRHPLGRTDFLDASFYQGLARTLEEGCFDLAFMPDTQAIPDWYQGSYETTLAFGGQGSMQLEPMLTLACMAMASRHLGLAATISTTYLPPFHIARAMATLDHLSAGRAAWNIVTSAVPTEARNFGDVELPPRDQRYDLADEVLEACEGLWHSWEEGALMLDRESGRFADPDRVHYVDHDGSFRRVRGPLTLPRSPQERPVLMQAGSSERGREFAARWAEVIFTLQRDIPSIRAFREDIRRRATAIGRDPDSVRVFPAVQPIVGETREIAVEKQKYLESLVDPEVAIATISVHTGIDFSGYDLDGPVPDVPSEGGTRGSFEQILRGAEERGLNLREAAQQFATNELTPQLVGTAAEVADQMEEIFGADACDGFIVTPTTVPTAFEEFARGVTPELQRRGLLRDGYPEGSLRDLMKLPPIPNNPRTASTVARS